MGKNNKKLMTTTKYLVVLCVLMLFANVILGITLTVQSVNYMRSTLDNSMIAVSDTATSFIDVDELKTLTKDDAPEILLDENGKEVIDDDGNYIITREAGQKYKDIAETLNKIIDSQNNGDIKYIYIVARDEEKSTAEQGYYYFTVDPDTSMPAYWGKKVVHTDAQDVAWQGTTAVDNKPYEDDWGKYYTAWSPIKDGDTVVSLVGVDFAAETVDGVVSNYLISILIFIILTVAVSSAIIVIFTLHLRKRFKKLNGELTTLSNDLETLFSEIDKDNVSMVFNNSDIEDDAYTIESLSHKTIEMQKRLKEHFGFMQKQANTDYLTDTGNFRAYCTAIEELENDIKAHTAEFALAIFDINHLKQQNDTYGHEYGNALIATAAKTVKDIFGNDNIYRIGGDEFIVIIKGESENAVKEKFAALDEKIAEINKTENAFKNDLSLSKGYAFYVENKDETFRDVFDRADKNMYADKEEYYKKTNQPHIR